MRYKKTIAATALLLCGGMTLAQDENPNAFSYVTYYVCDVATQGQMDTVVEQYEKPALDQAVEDGRIGAWGYFSHMTGGPWRRLQFHTAATIEQAIENQATIFGEIYSDNPEGGQARAESCAGHDDYIWAATNGGGDAETQSASSLSVYYVCDISRENEADDIIAEVYAPVLNRLAEEGKLDSWSWLSHRVGGEYRRLQTFLGPSHAAVLAARAEMLQATGGPAGNDFADICWSHSDYLWNIEH